MKTINTRITEYPISDIFLERYSPRAFSGEVILDELLMTLFEAARWAPSSRNNQPWRFMYGKKDTSNFDLFLSFLTESNQVWCKNASALVVVASKQTQNDGTPYPSHSLEAGSAWENLALQATEKGLIAHGMGGFDPVIAKEKLEIPDGYTVEMMIAIGKPGNILDLPEKLREREKPSQRKELKEIVFEGKFKN